MGRLSRELRRCVYSGGVRATVSLGEVGGGGMDGRGDRRRRGGIRATMEVMEAISSG